MHKLIQSIGIMIRAEINVAITSYKTTKVA